MGFGVGRALLFGKLRGLELGGKNGVMIIGVDSDVCPKPICSFGRTPSPSKEAIDISAKHGCCVI